MNGDTPNTSSQDPHDDGDEKTRILKPPADGGWVTPPPENWASSWASETRIQDDRVTDQVRDEVPGEVRQTPAYASQESRSREAQTLRLGADALRAPEPFQAPEPEWLAERDIPVARKKPRLFLRFFRDFVFPLGIAFGIAMFVQATIAKPYQIPSGSMLPTIQLEDRILANRMVYRFYDIKRGDVVVFKPPDTVAEQGTPYVKRVVGLPGDTVEIRNGQVLVNDREMVVEGAHIPAYTKARELVPDGQLFVLGDNRNESSDSHIWGFVPKDNVIGKAQVIYWPPEHFEWIGN